MTCAPPADEISIDWTGPLTLCWHTAARFEAGRPYCATCLVCSPSHDEILAANRAALARMDSAAAGGHDGALRGPEEDRP